MILIFYITLIIIASLLIAKVCDIFEVSTDYLGRNMSDGVKGATLNAIGSSMPELLTTVFFLVNSYKDPDIGDSLAASFGGDTGSAVFNSIVIPIFVIIAVLLKKGSFKLTKKVILRDGMFLIGAELLLLILLSSDTITWIHGLVFTMYYIVYLAYALMTMKKTKQTSDINKVECNTTENNSGLSVYEKYLHKTDNNKGVRAVLLLITSMLLLAGLCDLLVIGAEGISEILNISTLIVALVVVAAASSVPDLIISVKDAKKGNYNDSLSNVLGSNIFDISISAGLPLMLFLLFTGTTIDFTKAGPTLIDIRIGLLLVTIIVVGVLYFLELNIKTVLILTVLYILFLSYAFYSANGGETLVPEFIITNLNNISNYITHSWV